MGCLHPLKAFDTGLLTENGKPLYYIVKGNSDLLPLSTVFKAGFVPGVNVKLTYLNGVPFLCDPVPVGCGKCVGCRKDYASTWTRRLVLENRQHKVCYFVTLTYSEDNVPKNEQGYYIENCDLRAFVQRARYYFGKGLSWFACSEYGETTHRPHFHMILWDCEFPDKVLVGKNKFVSSFLDSLWGKGKTELSLAEPGCFAYVAGYCQKKWQDPAWDSYQVKPKLFMSKKPPLGYKSFKPDPSFKVYGDFSTSHQGSVPRAFQKKQDGTPWLVQLKELAVKNAKSFAVLEKGVFGIDDPEEIADAKTNAIKAEMIRHKRSQI